MNSTVQRQDFLASVCVIENVSPQTTLTALTELSHVLQHHFRYWEIVYLIGPEQRDLLNSVKGQLSGIKNLRVIVCSEAAKSYEKRLIAASEAIGDVVALTDGNLCGAVNIEKKLIESYASNEVILVTRDTVRWFAPISAALSLISIHRINADDTRTMILPRERLNIILTRSTSAIDLRFEPKNPPFRYRRLVTAEAEYANGIFNNLQRKFELLSLIVMSSASRYLKAFSAASLFVVFFAIMYGLYAVAVFAFVGQVQPGWFSTAIVESGSVAFIASSVAVMCLALASIYEQIQKGTDERVISELTNTDFYAEESNKNVEVELCPK